MVSRIQFSLWLCAFALTVFLPLSTATPQDNASADLKTMSPQKLIEAFGTATQSESTEITDMIIDKKKDSLPVLRETILRGTPKQKILACRLLGEMRDMDALANLSQAVQEPDVQVKVHAINALREIGDPSAARVLRKLMKEEKNKGAIICTLLSIGKLGDKSDMEKLKEYLANPEADVKVTSAVALAMLGDTGVQDILIDMSYEKEPFVSRTAVKGLGYLNTNAATKRLNQIVAEPNARWKNDARIAITQHQLKGKSPLEQATILKTLAEDKAELVAEWAVDTIADSNIPEKKTILENIAKTGAQTGVNARRLLKVREVR